MFFTIDDIVSGKKHNVNIMWITSLKNGNDEKSAPNFELLLFQGDGGRPLIESFTTAEERNQRRQAIIEAGSFFIFDDIHYNIVWVQSIAKVNVGDDLYDGTRSQRPGTAVTFANGRVLYGMFDTEAERDEFYDKLMETMLSGGLIQKDTFYDFPKNGNPNCVYLAKDTGITYYWDPELKMYVTTGSGGRKGVYEYNGTLSATTGVRATLNKSDLREIVKATVDFMETSDVIDSDGNHAIIVQNDSTTVDVITIADQTIDSFKQVLTLTDLPTTGKTNILFYVDDIDEFRIWDEANSEWVEPFHPIVFDGSIAVADARLNTLYVDGTIAKYTNDNVSWTYLSSVLFEDSDLADAIPDTLYINDSVAKYTVDNSKWIYLSSIFFENPDVADAIVKSLYIDGNIAKYTLNNTDWIYLNTEVVRYDQDIKYHEGTLVYINNVLAKAVKDFTSDNSGTDKFASFSKDVYNGNLEVIVDAYTRTNVQYDLTNQLDGVKQVFDIPAVVTNDRSILVFYAGQLLVEGVNYTIDFDNCKLRTYLETPPEKGEDRHLILIVGNIETTPPTVRTVTGIEPGLVDNSDPLNPVILHDDTKLDKDGFVGFVTDVRLEQSDADLTVTKDKADVGGVTTSSKLKVTSSDESILFSLDDTKDPKVLDIKSTHSNNIMFDISDQMDGEVQEFTIDSSITNKKSMLVFYAGQMLVPGENYTVDYDNHKLTTLLPEAPTADEGRHLILIVGDVVAASSVLTVTGEGNLVDNTDISNPVVKHDDTKLDKDTLENVLTSTSITKSGDDIIKSVESIKVSDRTKTSTNLTITSSNDSIVFDVDDSDPTNTKIDITSTGVIVYDNPFVFDGVSQEFNLPVGFDILKKYIISVNGVILSQGVDKDYTISGSKIKFSFIFETESNSKIIYFK